CDNGREFRNKEMNDFCSQKGIKKEFSNARTPRQNGVTERRNKTLIEAARTMYSMSSKAFRVFNNRTKRVDENLHVDFLENNAIDKGDGPNWLFDIVSLTKSMNYVPVVVAGTNSTNFSCTKDAASQEVKKDVSSLRYIALPNWIHEVHLESSSSQPQDTCNSDEPESSGNSNPTATSTNLSADQLETLTVETPISTVSSPVPTACLNDSLEPSGDTRLISKRVANQVKTASLDNILTLTNRFEDILRVTKNSVDSDGVKAGVSNMETTITASPTPTLRIHKDHPKSQIISPVDTLIQTRHKSKKNKKDKRGIVIRNKARLVAQGHTQEAGIDYDEVFAPVARIEAIRLFLAYASFMGFTVYQMDVKSAFLYSTIDEEVYVMQPPRFQNPKFPAKVYKVEKAMYGLHQAPRAWYGTLSKYLLTNGFQRGTIDQTLFIRRQRGDFILVQVYVDDIIFRSLNLQLCREFEALMHEKFQMSAMGELNSSLIYKSYRRRMAFFSLKKNGKLKNVSESSIRRNLKLNDEAGISSLPDVELFKNLQLMGYNILPNQKFTFQKRAVFPSVEGEGSGTPTESHHTPASEALQSSQHQLPSPSLLPSSILPPVADEPASPLGGVSQGKACPTDSGFEADQDRANIAKTSILPSDSTPRVTSLTADEGNDAPIKGRRLDEWKEAAEKVSDDTEEMATVLTFMDAASIITSGGVQVVSTAAEVATVTLSIPTGSGVVSTASPIIPTAALIFTTATESTLYTRRKGKEKMVESDTPKKKKLQEQIDVQVARELEEQIAREDQRMSEQIARDAEVARIHAEEELQMMINSLDRSNETVVKYLQEYEQIPKDLSIGERIELISDLVKYQENYAQVLKYQTLQRKPRSKKQKKDYYMAVIKGHAGWKTKDFKGMSFEQIEAKFNTVWKQIEDFIPMGSKEEAERKFTQKDKEVIGRSQGWEAAQPATNFFVDMLKHFDREDLNQLWGLVKETLSIRPATIEWKLYDTCGVHHVSTKDQDIFMLIEKDYPLRKGLSIVIDEFPLSEQLPTANEDKFPLLMQSDATAVKLALLLKSRNNEKYTISNTKHYAARYYKEGIKDRITERWSKEVCRCHFEALNGIHHWEENRIDFFKAGISAVTGGNVFSNLRIISVLRIDVKKKWGYGSNINCGQEIR
nr:putative ribonuclease H-like domain-containing protein [Tanacetum cinerariifolium]